MRYKNYIAIAWRTILLALVIAIVPAFGSPLDSLRTEQINGKLFIIHQVDQGETLYAISRRYKVSIPTIVSYNPSVEEGLKTGKLIKILLVSVVSKVDTTAMTAHKVKSKETLFSLSKLYGVKVGEIKGWNNLVTNELNVGQILYINPQTKTVPEILQIDLSNKITHKLQQGETLYSLSKKYEVSIDQLKSWNNLQENTLSIGQLLIVGEKSIKNPVEEPIAKVEENTISIDSSKTRVFETRVPADTSQTSKRIENINGFEEIVESGIGELIPGSIETRKYFGLHRTAKIGTIMKVRNAMNNKMVYVRIIGRIPNTGDNKKVLLKISKAAYDRLGIIDPRFRVEVSYMP